MIITKLTEQTKDKNRVNVFVDGRYSLSLTLQQVLDEKIKVGLVLAETDITRLTKLSEDGKLKARTIEWLNLRPHSEKELRDYLRRKNVDNEQVSSWVIDFQKYGYQNDESFAVWWIDQRRRKHRSDSFIRNELRLKGINTMIIETTLSTQEGNDKQSLKKLIEKKRQQSRYADTKKLTGYLLRQGYRYSDIAEALAEAE